MLWLDDTGLKGTEVGFIFLILNYEVDHRCKGISAINIHQLKEK